MDNSTHLGKLMLVIGWGFTVISGQIVCYMLSGAASVLAIVYWMIKIGKELKK